MKEVAVVAAAAKWRSALTLLGWTMNEVVSFVVFCLLDLVDAALCFTFKVADYVIEAEWPPCYCSSSKEVITGSGNIVVSEKGEYSKIVCLTSSKLQLEEVSDTLYNRPSLVSEFSWLTVKRKVARRKFSSVGSRFTINSSIVEILQRRVVGKPSRPLPRWSDCDCRHCTAWTYRGKKTLFVRAAGNKEKGSEDVLFIHGFISSSAFWTETLFPNFSESAKSKYRFLAVDLLGFGRSPKPTDSLYTLREHLDMIEQSVLQPFGVKSFHIVAHSLGCILALALAVKHPDAVKSLTLLAPPYYPIPKGTSQATQYVMRRIAPRRVWPIIAFGASLACWYEHITRAAHLVFSRHHHFWEQLTKRITRNRIRTFLLDGFFCHTHKAMWHTLHNVICGGASKLETYLNAVNERLRCDVTVFHGKDDELIPVECSYNVQRLIPRANVKVIDNKDHLTIVVGRQISFARDLEQIWSNSISSSSSSS